MSRGRFPRSVLPMVPALALAVGAWTTVGCDVGLASADSDPSASSAGNDRDGGGSADSDGATRVIAPTEEAGALGQASPGSVRCGAKVGLGCSPDALEERDRCDAVADAPSDAAAPGDAAGASLDAADGSADAAASGAVPKADVDASIAPEAAAIAADAGAATLARSCHVRTTAAGVASSCEPAGGQTVEAFCSSSADCAAGLECVGSPGHCRHYCCQGQSTCDAVAPGTFCDVQPLAEGKVGVPVCAPLTACTLLAGDTCPTGKTCAIVKNDGTTSCVDVGEASLGAPCDTMQCAAGLTCLGAPAAPRCYQLCRLTSVPSCTDGRQCVGSSQLVTNNQIGLCQ